MFVIFYLLIKSIKFLYLIVPNAVNSITISNEQTNGFELSWDLPLGNVEKYEVGKF